MDPDRNSAVTVKDNLKYDIPARLVSNGFKVCGAESEEDSLTTAAAAAKRAAKSTGAASYRGVIARTRWT